MQVEKIKQFPDGNWAVYGALNADTGKRVELARGHGDCPYAEGEQFIEDAEQQPAAPKAAKPAAKGAMKLELRTIFGCVVTDNALAFSSSVLWGAVDAHIAEAKKRGVEVI